MSKYIVTNTPEIRVVSRELFFAIYGKMPPLRKNVKEVAITTEVAELYDPVTDCYIQGEPGYVFDGASIPKWLWSLFTSSFGMFLLWSLFHDIPYLLKGSKLNASEVDHVITLSRELTRKQTDDIFRRGLRQDLVPDWKVKAAYLAVRIFGGRLWRKDFDPDNVMIVDYTKIERDDCRVCKP